jgi:hypothetical protein
VENATEEEKDAAENAEEEDETEVEENADDEEEDDDNEEEENVDEDSEEDEESEAQDATEFPIEKDDDEGDEADKGNTVQERVRRKAEESRAKLVVAAGDASLGSLASNHVAHGTIRPATRHRLHLVAAGLPCGGEDPDTFSGVNLEETWQSVREDVARSFRECESILAVGRGHFENIARESRTNAEMLAVDESKAKNEEEMEHGEEHGEERDVGEDEGEEQCSGNKEEEDVQQALHLRLVEA